MQRYGYILYLPNFCKVFFKKNKKNFVKKQKKFVKTLQNCKKMRNFVMILFCAARSNKTSFLIGTQK